MKNILGYIAALVLVVMVLWLGSLQSKNAALQESLNKVTSYVATLGGTTNFNDLSVDSIAVNGTSTVGQIVIDSGSTAINEFNCVSTTYDPAAISSTTDATTTIALSGVAPGDIVFSTFDSVTSTENWFITPGGVKAAGSSTVTLKPVVGSAAWNAGLNLTTSTLKTCYFGF